MTGLSTERLREDLTKATRLLDEGDVRGAVLHLEDFLAEVSSCQRGTEVVVTYVRTAHSCPMME